MKKRLYVLMALVLLFCCFGCSEKTIEIKSGSYVFENSEMLMDPVLEIDTENQHFSFTYGMLSSYVPTGSYQIKDNILTATTDDGDSVYCFKIIDEEIVTFLEEGSSIIPSVGEKQTIADGVEFTYSNQAKIDLLRQRIEYEIKQDGSLKYYICKLIEFSMHRFDRTFVDFEPQVEIQKDSIRIVVPNLFYGARGMEELYTDYQNHLELNIRLNGPKNNTTVEHVYHSYRSGVYSAPSSSSPYDKFEVQFMEKRSSNSEYDLWFSDCGRGIYSMVFDDAKFRLLVNDKDSPYYQKSLPDKGEKNVSIYYIAKVLQWNSDDFEGKLNHLADVLSNVLIQNAKN